MGSVLLKWGDRVWHLPATHLPATTVKQHCQLPGPATIMMMFDVESSSFLVFVPPGPSDKNRHIFVASPARPVHSWHIPPWHISVYTNMYFIAHPSFSPSFLVQPANRRRWRPSVQRCFVAVVQYFQGRRWDNDIVVACIKFNTFKE